MCRGRVCGGASVASRSFAALALLADKNATLNAIHAIVSKTRSQDLWVRRESSPSVLEPLRGDLDEGNGKSRLLSVVAAHKGGVIGLSTGA